MNAFTPSHEQLLLNSIHHKISTNMYPVQSVTAEHVDEIELSESSSPVSSPYTASLSDSQSEVISADMSDIQPAKAPTSLRTKAKGFWLIVSPYIDPEHQLNLTTVDTGSQLFALALTNLEPATPSYAAASYDNALNWLTIFETLKALTIEHSYKWRKAVFYVVEFRSKLKATIDNDLLFRLDRESHREATASGGLLKYWYGKPDMERRNLATCLWRSKEDAIAGGKGPQHKQARSVIPQMYESIDVKGLKLTIEDDVTDWTFEQWRD